VRLTLDELEAERGDVDPFEIDLGSDGVVSLPHPKDMPFESIIGFDGGNPTTVLRALMGDDTFDTFVANKRITLGMLESILTRYYQHFGLGGPGEGNGSPNTSRGSATRSRRASQRSTRATA